MSGLKRFAVVVASLLLAGMAAPAALGQSDYPNRPVRLIVGFIPGSSADITARVLGQRMGQILGQQFVVEGKPGAGSSLAAEFVARAPKDGYTMFIGSSANITNAAINPNLRHRQGFRAGRAHQHGGRDPGRAPFDRGQDRAGADRARQIQARGNPLCLHRRRHGPASLRRAPVDARRPQARARALPGLATSRSGGSFTGIRDPRRSPTRARRKPRPTSLPAAWR